METMLLKADLHLHTRERDAFIAYSARELIDQAARPTARTMVTKSGRTGRPPCPSRGR